MASWLRVILPIPSITRCLQTLLSQGCFTCVKENSYFSFRVVYRNLSTNSFSYKKVFKQTRMQKQISHVGADIT
ncbi:hypothetical protein KC19_8G129700 [Ceratodon purpureus]|uniref:Secreted protein n=1 Tax=Ceratodon purpureus TaxID=3225 RepID=A0A8T0GYA4_CERPU|nr:hypothetical protein KC19_8G129700 [Ceratodon purpureus]